MLLCMFGSHAHAANITGPNIKLNSFGKLSVLQGNQLSTMPCLCLDNLKDLKRLTALYLQQPDRTSANPVCALNGYRRSILAALPSLANLDGER